LFGDRLVVALPKAKRLGIEATRDVEVGDDDPDVIDRIAA
jgi:hypothetical protein